MDRQLLKSLLMLGSVVEARDPYTGGHLWRVAEFAKLLSAQLKLSSEEQFEIGIGAFLHDLGKVGIPDNVLLKNGPLTDDEFATIRTHPAIGGSLLREHPLGHLAVDVVEHHHNWIDGRGYPGVASNEEFSIASQIVGLVDTFDAVTSVRPYHQAKTIEEAFALIDDQRSTQFDGKLIDEFKSLADSGEFETIIGHSFDSRPLVNCPSCGPVIAISGDAKKGDEVPCRACGGLFHLHAFGDTFVVESANQRATFENIAPRPDTEAIDHHLAEILS